MNEYTEKCIDIIDGDDAIQNQLWMGEAFYEQT
jgi:hypothetical protein